MPSVIDFAALDLRGAFDFAIMIEEDAQIRYQQLSRLLGDDPGGAGDVFRMMVVNEGKHRSELLARRDALFRKDPARIEISVVDAGVERPDVQDDELPRTARAALEVALAAENRAYDFFRNAVLHIQDPAGRAFFGQLMQEEVKHAALIAEKIGELEARANSGREGEQSGRAVASTAPAETYSDRALLETVIPRFDAATQAVAVAVIVDGMKQEEVAVALGVSRGTVARKLTRFLDIARQHIAVALAAAALTGCAGGLPHVDATAHGTQAESPQASAAILEQADGDARVMHGEEERTAEPDGGERIAERDGGERTAEHGGVERTVPYDGGDRVAQDADADFGVPDEQPSRGTDWEFSAGLRQPAQQEVLPALAPWSPGADADARAQPVIDDVWPNNGRSSGGDRVVIRGKNLQAVQVLFGLVPGVIVQASEHQLIVAAPTAAAGQVAVVVTNRDGNYAVAAEAFRYLG